MASFYYPVSDKVVAGLGIYVPSGMGALVTNAHNNLPHAYVNRNGIFRWKDTVQFRGGIEYKTGNLAWRAGYYNDLSPVPDQTLNVLLPSFNLNAFTIGLGFPLGRLEFDFGFEFLKGKQRVIPSALIIRLSRMPSRIQMPKSNMTLLMHLACPEHTVSRASFLQFPSFTALAPNNRSPDL
jgi:long-subunit fatty acid transport protein